MILTPIVLPPPPAARRWKTGAAAAGTENPEAMDEKTALPAVDSELEALRKEVKELKEKTDEFTTQKLVTDVGVGLVAEEALRRGYEKVSKTDRFKKTATKVGSAKQNIKELLKNGVARLKSASGSLMRGMGKAGGRLVGGLRILLTAAGLKVMIIVLALSYLARLGKRLYDYKAKGLPPGMTGKQFFYNSLIPFKGLPPAIHGPVAKAIQKEPAFQKQLSQLPKGSGPEIRRELAKVAKQGSGNSLKFSKSEKEKIAGIALQRASEAGLKLRPSREGLSVTASAICVAV